ncbi:31200_t:CDS:2, partial [Gigaspora margarita]
IFEDGTAVDVEAVAVVDDVGGTIGDVEATAALMMLAAAIVDDIDDIGLFAAVVVSDIIGIFDLVGVASFDDVGIGVFDNVGVGAFEDTADIMFLR